MNNNRLPPEFMPEPDDEKTPVSTYQSLFTVRIRDADPPRPAATRASALPIPPRASNVTSRAPLFEPSIVVEAGDHADEGIDSRSDTLYMVRRRHARTLELTLLAGLSALLAAAVALWLARAVAGKDSRAADPARSNSNAMPSVAASGTIPLK